MLPENPRERAGLAVAALTLLGLGVAAWAGGQTSSAKPAITVSPDRSDPADSPRPIPDVPLPQATAVTIPDQAPALPAPIVVHVSGIVRSPGVYTLPAGSRLQRAIHAAGGFGRNADREALNLAARLEDSDQIVVPAASVESEPIISSPQEKPSSTDKPGTPARGRKISKVPAETDKPKTPAKRKFSKPGDGTVALNSADSAALQQLPGVGKSTAERILEARKEKGRFAAIEDLAEVKGVGEKRLERLRPFLKLE